MSTPEYLLTDLPQYVHTTPRSDFANSIVEEGLCWCSHRTAARLQLRIPTAPSLRCQEEGWTRRLRIPF